MKRAWSWSLVAGMLAVWTVGCQSTKPEPVATHEQPPPFPTAQEQPPEPQPPSGAAASPQAAPPVDTAAEPSGGRSAAKSQKPKEHYAPAAKKTSATYVVKKGDTLQSISKKYYKTTKDWRRIYNANRNVLKKGPDDLAPGMKLAIP